jgi:transposase-like protein
MKATSKTEKERSKGTRRSFTGREKSEAVLAVWSERRKPSEVCRQWGINYAMLLGWQRQGLEAMMRALEPRTKSAEQKGPALGPKLEKLLERTSQRVQKVSKLEQRLEQIQTQKVAAK